VPSKCIFLSSKETCTDHRNRLSSTMLEALQILKFTYKQKQLNFTTDLITNEKDYVSSSSIIMKATDKLIASGKLDKLL
ncbi:hypothetical protein F5I97DRAFT_1800784, partial [Phlebopus sp. FC_14]